MSHELNKIVDATIESNEETKKQPRKLKRKDESCVAGNSGNLKPICYGKNNIGCFHKDPGEVPRLFSPYNNFGKIRLPEPKRTPVIYSPHRSNGLSPKEKCYIIYNCQNRTTQYAAIKLLAKNAIEHNKIFTIYGNNSCAPIRKALLNRGWVEKLPPHRMNLQKVRDGTLTDKTEIHGELEKMLLSNLVEKYESNFIWRTKEEFDTTIDMTKDTNTVFNKLKLDALWTTKQGLCSTMKRNYWFHVEGVAEVIGPRTYVSSDVGDIEGFIQDYKITACTSLLKWIISMVTNETPIFDDEGSISKNVIVFALNRCKEYILRKQHKDIDESITTVTTGQWNAFLKKYYKVISKAEKFKTDKDNKLLLYLRYAKFLLKEIHKFRPQLGCEGCHNIWIMKPSFCCRGRGIKMASRLGTIKNMIECSATKYVLQKYIEEPLLIHDTKFDIRQYYIVTSTYPLVIWMYQDCYLKFSSQKYSLKNFHEAIHLTNNAVQKKYQNCNGRHADLPLNNMWDLEKYKSYLNKTNHSDVWDKVIYPGMKKSIIGVMLSCQDSMSYSKNRFELYGCDFILDKEYKPWIIEINACPDLNWTTQVTANICPAVLEDIIKVVVDRAANSKASTGLFECIYKQPMTVPRYYGMDFAIRCYGLPIDYFYKGHNAPPENHDNVCNDLDINTTIKVIKELHDNEISDLSKKEDNESLSDVELIEDPAIMENKIQELYLQTITQDANSEENFYYPRTVSKVKLSPAESVSSKSATDVNSLIKESIVHRTSSVILKLNAMQFVLGDVNNDK